MLTQKYQNIHNLNKPRQQGFTIVELLIVIIVIAILAALVITAYTGIQAQARESAAKQKASEVIKALTAYNVEHGEWPEDPVETLKQGNNVNINVDGQIVDLFGSIDKSKIIVQTCDSGDPPFPITGALVTYLSSSADTTDFGTMYPDLQNNAKVLGSCPGWG